MKASDHHLDTTPGTTPSSPTLITCSCEMKWEVAPSFVHAILQRHVQVVNNNPNLEVAKRDGR